MTLATVAWFALAAIASVAFVVIAAELRRGALDRIDPAIELAVHRLDSPAADIVMTAASQIGANGVLLPVVAAVALLAIHRRRRIIAIVLVLDTAVVIGANNALKVMFARERPRLFDKVALPTSYSFPSGHAMSALAIWGVVAAALIALSSPAWPGRPDGPGGHGGHGGHGGRDRAARRCAIAGAAVLIATIGFSRVYLGVHWPSDVVGGFLGGVPPLVASVHAIHRGR
ncbi:MAG TPA: phosphatase PAP2 family protein [Kofleriaceae bacterium]|nr:phosphatase PAP2 family protein [Kofleriaceae bacterium]